MLWWDIRAGRCGCGDLGMKVLDGGEGDGLDWIIGSDWVGLELLIWMGIIDC